MMVLKRATKGTSTDDQPVPYLGEFDSSFEYIPGKYRESSCTSYAERRAKQREKSEYKKIIKDTKKTSDQIVPPGQTSPLSSMHVRMSSPLTRLQSSLTRMYRSR